MPGPLDPGNTIHLTGVSRDLGYALNITYNLTCSVGFLDAWARCPYKRSRAHALS